MAWNAQAMHMLNIQGHHPLAPSRLVRHCLSLTNQYGLIGVCSKDMQWLLSAHAMHMLSQTFHHCLSLTNQYDFFASGSAGSVVATQASIQHKNAPAKHSRCSATHCGPCVGQGCRGADDLHRRMRTAMSSKVQI